MSELLDEYPYLLALLIFLARVADVSPGTFRLIGQAPITQYIKRGTQNERRQKTY